MRIAIPTHHQCPAAVLSDPVLGAHLERGGLVEVRVDLFAPEACRQEALESLWARIAPQAIVTVREPEEGGARRVPEKLVILEAAGRAKVAFADLEYRWAWRETAVPLVRQASGGATKIVLSYHDFQKTSPELEHLLPLLEREKPEVIKLATMAHSIREALCMLRLARKCAVPFLGLCMGEAGLITRLLGGKFGAPFTFGAAGENCATAPGQPTARQLSQLYRADRVGPGTAVYGVIANPVVHSLSPAVHNAAFARLGLDAVYVPLLVESDAAGFVSEALEVLDLRGASVTIPHKREVMGACCRLETLAENIGAVNTLVREDQGEKRRFAGYNTDCQAALGPLRRSGGVLRDLPVLLLGAGGAARAIAWGLKEAGARVTIANRTAAKAQELAREIGARAWSLEELAEHTAAAFAVIVNTTSLGMYPHAGQTPLAAELFPPARVKGRGKPPLVFDAVYNPLHTRLLREAQQAGLRTLDGVEMFVAQAAEQFRLWTGKEAPQEAMRQAVLERLEAG